MTICYYYIHTPHRLFDEAPREPRLHAKSGLWDDLTACRGDLGRALSASCHCPCCECPRLHRSLDLRDNPSTPMMTDRGDPGLREDACSVGDGEMRGHASRVAGLCSASGTPNQLLRRYAHVRILPPMLSQVHRYRARVAFARHSRITSRMVIGDLD